MQIQWWNILKNRLTWIFSWEELYTSRALQEEFNIEGDKEILNRDDRKREK